MSNEATPLIYKKIAAIKNEVGAVEKTRRNQQQGFAFRGVDDVYNALHGIMATHGVFSVPTVVNCERGTVATKSGGLMQTTLSTVRYELFAEDGSSVVGVVTGESADSGDKSAGKAMSYAHKVFLIQTFMLETNEQEADHTSHEYVAKPNHTPAQQHAAQARQTPAARPSAPRQEQPQQSGGDAGRGIVEGVEQKETKTNKPYWRVKISGIGWLSTWHKSVGELAPSLDGCEVDYTYSTKGDFKNLETMVGVQQNHAGISAGAADDDGLDPFADE